MNECIQWSDNIWLHTFGLNRGNILEYFYNSPFYDPSSNNQHIRTQAISLDFLKSCVGIQYIVDDASCFEPNLYVIKKVRRASPHATFLQTVYFCLDGVVFESPNLLELVRSRTVKLSNHLLLAFEEIRGNLVIDSSPSIEAMDEGPETNSVVTTDRGLSTPKASLNYMQKLPPFDLVLRDLENF